MVFFFKITNCQKYQRKLDTEFYSTASTDVHLYMYRQLNFSNFLKKLDLFHLFN